MTFNRQYFNEVRQRVCCFKSEQLGESSYQLPPINGTVTLETICSQLSSDAERNIAMLFYYGPPYFGCDALSYEAIGSDESIPEDEARIPLSLDGQDCYLKLSGLPGPVPAHKKEAFCNLLLQQERATRQLHKLNEIESYDAALFDNCPDGLVVSDTEGIIVDANRTFVRMCGIPKEKLLGMPGHALVTPRYQRAAKEVIAETLLKGTSRFKGRLRMPGNADLPIRASTQTFSYQGQTLLFSVIREFSNLDEKVWRFEQYNRSLAHSFQRASDGYLTCSDAGEIIESNPAFSTLFGISSSELADYPLHELVCRNSLGVFRKSLTAVATTGFAAFSCYLQGKDGTRFPARVSLLRFQREERQAYRCIIQRTDGWTLPE